MEQGFKGEVVATKKVIYINQRTAIRYINNEITISGFYYQDCTSSILFPNKSVLNKLVYKEGIEIRIDTNLNGFERKSLNDKLIEQNFKFITLQGMLDTSIFSNELKGVGVLTTTEIL